ncbi:inositol monophosphatase family protein [Brucellaceae bacterium C25G]
MVVVLKDNEIDWLASVLADAAKTEIMPRFRKLDAGDIKQKTTAYDLVTEADINAEKMITRVLSEKYPDAVVLGEEAVSAGTATLGNLHHADLAFVIDPVDGTYNFASGVPLFGVMMSVLAKGETIAGIIYDPMVQDYIMAVRGSGAFHISGEQKRRMKVAEAKDISQMLGSVSWQYMPEPLRSRVAANQAKFMSQIGYRCAAHEYRLLADGHAHFAVYNKLMPWDHLAGSLIHAEAGGYSARFDGSHYMPEHVDGGLIVAPDKESWHAIKEALWS